MQAQIPLKEAIFSIWNKNYERQGLNNNFKPLFAQYIGIPDTEENYNNVLATLSEKISQNPNKAIIFDGQIQMIADFDLLNSVKQDLLTLDVFNLSSSDIVMFSDSKENSNFITALQYVIKLACRQENFQNTSIRNNFICTMLLHVFSYIKDMKFEDSETCKCIYYGDINKTEIYFLILLAKMGFDVLYLNPLRDNDFSKIDSDNLSVKNTYKFICPIESFATRVNKGEAISVTNSITLQLEREIENELYDGSGMFKPWQYRNGTTKSILLNGNLIDLEQNIDQPAKFRRGFSVNGSEVSVPHLFMLINGEDRDVNKYKKFINKCKNSPKTKFTINPKFADNFYYHSPEQKSEMAFCLNGNGTFDIQSVKELSFYSFKEYDEEPQNFYLNKVNEIILNSDIFVSNLNSSQEKINFLSLCLSLPIEFFDLINNFDFTGDIPKIVIFLEGRDVLSEKSCQILGLFSVIGFDIIIFAPSGMNKISSKINPAYFSTIMLDNLNTETRANDYYSMQKESFLEKILSIF